MAEINTADIEKSNKLLETQKELILKVSSAMGALKGMLSGVDLSGLLTPLTAGLDGILALLSKLGQATGTWMQGLDLSGLAGSFAGLASAIGPVVKPFAGAVRLTKKHEKKHTEKGMGEVGRIRRKEGMPMGAAA